MEQESIVIGLMVACPGVLALGALALAAVFFKKSKESKEPTVLKWLSVIFLVIALGVGACYGVLLTQ